MRRKYPQKEGMKMDKKLKAGIYCRVISEGGRNLLSHQEKILSDLAKTNDIKVTFTVKEVSNGKGFFSYEMKKVMHYIKAEKIDVLLIYSKKRISIFDDLYEEFEMLCREHNVTIVVYNEIYEPLWNITSHVLSRMINQDEI